MVDMSFKFFLDMVPEDNVINPSTLTRFRRQHLKNMDLLDMLINQTVSITIEKGILQSKTIILDSIHTSSRSNPHSSVGVLKMRSKELCKSLYEVDESIKDLFPVKNEDNDLEHELTYA